MGDVLYCNNPDWFDITPVSQDDGPNPLVPIAYSREYRDAMDYFRAVVKMNERSPRVLELIKDIIDMNPAHYTVWNYRQQVLFAINADLEEELEYIDEIAEDQMKNYQVWHHRQVIVDRLNKGDKELVFINSILRQDPKNYHGWSYRQWVVKRFDLWENEIDYTTELITLDIRNNSAWNYRFYTLFNNPTPPTADKIDAEIKYAQDHIQLAPNNTSSWAYLKGLLERTNRPLNTMESFLHELTEKKISSPFLLSLFVDIYEQNAQNTKSPVNDAAIQMCVELATHLDAIREKYWNYRKQQLIKLNRSQ